MSKRQVFGITLLVLFVLMILIRLPGLDAPLYDDEVCYVESATADSASYAMKCGSTHPPLFVGILSFFISLFGLSPVVFRTVPLIFGLINLALMYYLVKDNYSKKAAVLSTIVMGFSFYHVLMSLQVDIEGSILVTAFLLTTIFYLKYERTLDKKWLIWSGVGLGMALWSKYSTVFYIIALVVYAFLNTKYKEIFSVERIKGLVISFAIIFVIGLGIFSFFPISMYNFFLNTVGHSSKYAGFNLSILAISMLIFWAGPLLLGLFILQAAKWQRKDRLWLIWFIVIFVFYTFLIAGRPGSHNIPGGITDYSRYFMNLIIPLSVMAGVFLSDVNWKKKHLFFWAGLFVLSLISYFIINFRTTKYLARDFYVYLNALKAFDLNFVFSFTTSSGTLLGVNMGIMLFGIAITVILLLLYFVIRQDDYRKYVLVIFLAITFALNIFLAVEYVGPATSLDVNTGVNSVIDYVKANRGDLDFYSNDEGILLQANNYNVKVDEHNIYTGVYCENCQSLKSQLDEQGGLVAFVDFPPVDERMWDFVEGCSLIYSTISKHRTVGYIYRCGR